MFWKTDGKAIRGNGSAGTPRPAWPSYDTNLKMNPPLRTAQDREAILAGLVDGTLEIIGSDHAPHAEYEKEVEFDYAPFGITGLETQLPLSLMQLVDPGLISLSDLIGKFTVAPARLLGLAQGTLKPGADADVTVFDPERQWHFTREQSASKSRNTPFHNWPLKGRAIYTIVRGQVVWREETRKAGV
jgi:dihydroorotase